jgi:hypothetical protein
MSKTMHRLNCHNWPLVESALKQGAKIELTWDQKAKTMRCEMTCLPNSAGSIGTASNIEWLMDELEYSLEQYEEVCP